MTALKISESAAAYAAGLHDAGAGSWGEIAGHLRIVGMGVFDFRELASAATKWARTNVASGARQKIRHLVSRKTAGGVT